MKRTLNIAVRFVHKIVLSVDDRGLTKKKLLSLTIESAVSYGETARVVTLLAIRNITHYNTDQYQNWDELWLYLPPK